MEEHVTHSLVVSGRKQLVLQGVLHVDSFDETEINLETNMGILSLKGEGLHITQLSLETGSLTAEGFFSSFQYTESKVKGKGKGKGLLSKILK
ncbi:MAG: sporulation protein YabP [Desulfotomaculaceae bacterium]|nr:sporulation protein YabP [Desulfotomaculaceae bacterium]